MFYKKIQLYFSFCHFVELVRRFDGFDNFQFASTFKFLISCLILFLVTEYLKQFSLIKKSLLRCWRVTGDLFV